MKLTKTESKWGGGKLTALFALAIAGVLANVPDPATIPDPATGEFFFVAATNRPGAQTVSATAAGLDATPLVRTWDFGFSTPLTTRRRGICVNFR